MNGIQIEIDKEKQPLYWSNFLKYINIVSMDDYDKFILLRFRELSRYGAILNPLFAQSYNYDTLYFNNKDKFKEFVKKWSEYTE